MSLVTATDLTKSYGAQDVLKDISLAIPRQARIALVGPNGIGKTTLLRILVGIEDPDQGTIRRARSLKIGYLPQEASYSHSRQADLEKGLWAFCLEAFEDLREQEAKLRRLEEAMAEEQPAEDLLSRYGKLQERFEFEGGYTYPARARATLRGLGFQAHQFARSLDSLSGGEQTRAQLAHLLLEDPGLLILDEPTNHLDIEAVEWLEGWLRDWPGAAMIVSHDRYFLDRTVSQVLDLTADGIEVYRGNYTAYVEQRADRLQLRQQRFEAQQNHIESEEEYIRRNIAGQNTRQAQGRRKRLRRLREERALSRPRADRAVSIDFGPVDRSGDRVLETSSLEIGYDDSSESLFAVPDLLLRRGECAAVIGPNGAGKTTFLKTLMGQMEPFSGMLRIGASLQIGYFTQAHEGLIAERTALQEVMSVAPDMRISEARNYLARFLFTGDEVAKQVSMLSGGERGRLALAKLALQGANLLFLDEPTNHLDLPAQEVLQQSLADFPGTILLVSHDRYLIEALATQVWVISPEERDMRVSEGGYEAYLEARRQEDRARPTERTRVKPEVGSGPKPGKRDQASLAELEKRIEVLEVSLSKLGRLMVSVGEDVEKVRNIGERYAMVQKELEAEMASWEALAKELTQG